MSADWQTFLAWLSSQGLDDPGEVWSRFASLAHASTHADDLVPIVEAAEWLPDGHRLVIAAHLANHLGRIEASSQMETLRKELAAALDSMLAELDFQRAGTLAAGLITNLDELSDLTRWRNEIQARGFPYKFQSLEEFEQFKRELLQGLDGTGVPTTDVRIQGSSLRTDKAGDVDLVVFVDEGEFDDILKTRFNGRARKGSAALDLNSMGHDELLELARDIAANESLYNGQAKTFKHAMLEGSFNSKSDILKPLKNVKNALASKYPHLNLEAIGVQVRGGNFDLEPFMRLN